MNGAQSQDEKRTWHIFAVASSIFLSFPRLEIPTSHALETFALIEQHLGACFSTRLRLSAWLPTWSNSWNMATRSCRMANETSKSVDGALDHNAFLEMVTKDLEDILKPIKQSSSPPSQNFVQFRDEALALANELLEGLNKLKVRGPPGKWKSLRKALTADHSKDKIRKWVEKLNMLRGEFSLHMRQKRRCSV
jgi:hypothetical protein